MTDEKVSLQFPSDFVIKIFGAATDEFEIEALSIVRKHVPDLRETGIGSRLSKDGKYLALSIALVATSQEQLDQLYRELSANPMVLMTL